MKTITEIIALYVSQYPHLALLASKTGQQAEKALGDAMSHLACPAGITGTDALLISKLGI